jgi:YidC/Oxa1 family membrane protein insertase
LDKNAEEMTSDEKREAALMGLSTGPTLNQLIDEAKFHYVVKREPLRANSEAWSRVQSEANGSSKNIPEELKSWVGAANVAVETKTKAEAEAASVA